MARNYNPTHQQTREIENIMRDAERTNRRPLTREIDKLIAQAPKRRAEREAREKFYADQPRYSGKWFGPKN